MAVLSLIRIGGEQRMEDKGRLLSSGTHLVLNSWQGTEGLWIELCPATALRALWGMAVWGNRGIFCALSGVSGARPYTDPLGISTGRLDPNLCKGPTTPLDKLCAPLCLPMPSNTVVRESRGRAECAPMPASHIHEL
ncbi:PDZ and LIM domain protein 1 [Platysternon megacephalum]|uniref:PDZ and LIM domain protein 1 n=1 Tax=Platysternon megacephalum TaxID=55544 RepID=A0A4D9EBQ8_9SAUR|nr:PDZ and LIM domain protein 1 [Platysternon megacephalum]